MRRTDINKYSNSETGTSQTGKAFALTLSSFGRMIWKSFCTVFAILMIAGIIVGISLFSFIMGMKDESIKLDLNKLKLNYTSFIYVNDENGNPQEYLRLSGSEDRVWVNYDQIPEDMKNAMVAIEDKRFREHNGVDWRRTFGAALTLFTKGGDYGGSTITQQLVKNLTGENDVSLTRKVKEIFRALNLEKKYSKDEILETYLNVVSFGSGCQGVQAAANLYFDKDISECTLAECASIAGITQNPSAYTPLLHPQANKERQQTVLGEMYNQGFITKAEYDEAMEQSEHMVFVGKTSENVVDNVEIWDWYTDAMFEDVVQDLQDSLNISEQEATNMMYHGGLKIYSAMDQQAQTIAEEVFADPEIMDPDQELQAGFVMMGYDGRILATIGRRGEKNGNRLMSYAMDAQRQPGSTIKPLSVYSPAIEMGSINYSSLIEDKPIDNYFGPGRPGPNNADGKFRGLVTVQYALERSLNAPAARIVQMISPLTGFTFLTEQLHFTHLNPKTDSVEIAAMALGGLNGGVTVREMTSGYQIFGNGGKYYEPYTYYYVEDHDGNVILDNRSNEGTQAISSSTATIMHKLLRNVVYGAEGTGQRAAISGWEVFGKTGTTDDDKDSWFVGGTPVAVAGVWTGYEMPARLSSQKQRFAITIWKSIMTRYLEDKEVVNFTYDSNVISATFCTETGNLATGSCTKTKTGWYDRSNMPPQCTGEHASESSVPGSEAPLESELPEENLSVPEDSSIPPEESSEGFPIYSEPDSSDSSSDVSPPWESSSSESSESSQSSSSSPDSSGSIPPSPPSSSGSSEGSDPFGEGGNPFPTD